MSFLKKLFSPRIWTAFLMVIVICGLGRGVWDVVTHIKDYINCELSLEVLLLWLSSGQVVLGGIFVVILFRKLWKERFRILFSVNTWLPVRLLVYFVLLAVLITSVANGFEIFENEQMPIRYFFRGILFLVLDLWAILVLTCTTLSERFKNGKLRVLDIALVNIVIVLVLSEALISVFAEHTTSPLFWDESATESSIKKYRQKPYKRYFNFYLNSLGYHDQEFFKREENDFIIALIADSFGYGVVPYDYNYATVAERNLRKQLEGKSFRRVAVHNFSIPCTGPSEYAYLLETEVMDYDPSMVVLCIFIGNDIQGLWLPKRRYYCFQTWWLYIFPKRILTIHEESRRKDVLREGFVATAAPKKKSRAREVPDYIHDYTKESPTFSKEKFMEIENARIAFCRTDDPRIRKKFDSLFNALRFFKHRLGGKLMILLIPDELQVNDKLYQQIMEYQTHIYHYVRDYPQKKIVGFCEKNGIRVLDLLPRLKSEEKNGRTYHLRDTHWNSRGNRFAGEEIAKYILENCIPPP